MPKMFWFSESLETDLSINMFQYFNPTFCRGPNLSFFGLGPWAVIHGINCQIYKYSYLSNMIFNDAIWSLFSKLSENHDIGSTEFKLWQRKESSNHLDKVDSIVEYLSAAINFSTDHPMPKMFWFSESLETDLSINMFQYFNPTFCRGPNLSFFGLGPWAVIHGINCQIYKYSYLSNMIFNDAIWSLFSKLSENHDIGSTEFKLWQRKESSNHLDKVDSIVEYLSAAINFSTDHPMPKMFWFSESLETDLSINNFMFQSKFCRGPNLSFFGLGPWAIYYPWYRQIYKYFYLSNMIFDDAIWFLFF